MFKKFQNKGELNVLLRQQVQKWGDFEKLFSYFLIDKTVENEKDIKKIVKHILETTEIMFVVVIIRNYLFTKKIS